MKASKFIVLSASVVTAVAITACDKPASVNTDQEKASYAIGLQIGKSLKTQNAEVTVSSLVAGLNDGLGGKEPKLTQEKLQAAMQKMQETMMKKAQEAGEKNLKEGAAWLDKNKQKPTVKTTASGLQYEVVKEGAGNSPADTDIVKVHYTGTLTSGEKFDSSRDRGEPAEFPVKGVIPGWTEALKLMKPGAQYKLAIPANLAYGAQGRPGIPANSVLLFDVELIEVKPAPAPPAAAPQAAAPAGKADAKKKKK